MSDIEIGHVTAVGANPFEDLGFSGDEARAYQDASRSEIQQLVLLKEQLMSEIAAWINCENLDPEEAASILNMTQPCVSDVANRKGSKFTVDALVNMLARAGKPVRIVVG